MRGLDNAPIPCPQCCQYTRVDTWTQANPLTIGAPIEHSPDRKRKRFVEDHPHLSKRVRRNGDSRVYVRIERLTVLFKGEHTDLTWLRGKWVFSNDEGECFEDIMSLPWFEAKVWPGTAFNISLEPNSTGEYWEAIDVMCERAFRCPRSVLEQLVRNPRRSRKIKCKAVCMD